MILGVPVKETSESQVSCRAAKPPGWPAGSPTGSRLALDLPGNVTQRQTQAATPHAARYRILFHSIMNSSHFVFPFSSLAPSRRPLRVSASLVPCLLSERLGSHDKGARLLADAQTLLVPGNPPTRRKQFRANGNVQYCMLEARGRC